MLNTDKNLKLYYSISEVAAMFDVNESLLRFWEKEFPQLNPKKGATHNEKGFRNEKSTQYAIRQKGEPK